MRHHSYEGSDSPQGYLLVTGPRGTTLSGGDHVRFEQCAFYVDIVLY